MRFSLPLASCAGVALTAFATLTTMAAILAATPAVAEDAQAKDRVANVEPVAPTSPPPAAATPIVDAIKSEPVVEAPRAEPLKVEPVKVEPAKAEPAPAEAAKSEPAKVEAPVAEPAKAEAPKPEPVAPEPRAADAEPVAPAAIDPIGSALKAKLAETRTPKLADGEKEDRAALSAFYGTEGYAPIWVGRAGFNDRARAIAAEIRQADDWGLKASDFAIPALDAATSSPSPTLSDDQLAEAELRLSLAVLKYARHARGGRIAEPTSQLTSYIDRKAQLKDPKLVIGEIAKAADADAYLRGLHPKHDQFVKLREQLLALRAGSVAEKKIVKVPQGPKIMPGKSHPDVAIIRQRLNVPAVAIDGQPADETLYDDALVKAVTAFQAEKGVAPSKGAITSATRTAMNADQAPTVNTRKIIANMESWRWMPDDLGPTHVWVNIPEFTMRVVKNGQVIHSERVITGKVETQTPIFSDVMETVVIHPYWHVPESIKVKELYPGLARGGDTLTKSGLKMQHNGRDVSPQNVDWSSSNIKAFQIFQPPGPSNVLGVVKFLFPNKHQVYMHDTPTKHLFATSMRTYSHGCVRVRNPVRLAEVLLGEDKGWDTAKVAALVKNGPQNNEIALKTKFPVHVTYMTAWVDDSGKLGVSRDFYGHEERIALALDGKWNQIARGPDHLAPVKAEPIARLAESKTTSYPNTPLGDFFKNLFGGN